MSRGVSIENINPEYQWDYDEDEYQRTKAMKIAERDGSTAYHKVDPAEVLAGKTHGINFSNLNPDQH